MKKGLLKFFLLLVTWMLVITVSYAAQITLKNGRVIEGEIISFDKSSVTVKEPVSGIIKIPRERILKIEPPLEEKEVKKARIEPGIKKQEDPYIVDFRIREKKLISLCLSGGMNNINGGDLNGAIRDYKQLITDYNDYYSTDHRADWKELSWILNFKGEFLYNLSPHFSIGLGFEYLTKKNKGAITLSEENSDTIYEGGYYYTYSLIDNYSEEPSYTLGAIPITLNIYYFMTLHKKVEAFFVGGIGYYFGTLTYDNPYQSDTDYKEDYFSTADDTYLFTRVQDDSYEGTGTYKKATCNTIGFHGGIGVDIKLFSNISLVAEGIYRYVKFKDWNGIWSDNYTWDERWGWSDVGYSEDSGSVSESWNGKIWHYDEYENSDIGKWYQKMSLPERDPRPLEGEIKNVRQAEINLNGFSLRIGIKFSF